MRFFYFLSFLSFFSPLFSQYQVNTQFGAVQGAKNGNVVQFLGIPFAKPPVDSLRWKPTQAPDVWLNVLQTTTFKPACAQKEYSQTDTVGKLKGSEDCLYLNVWTPQLDNAKRAVMVFIHGGGNQQGSASDSAANTALYFGKNVAERSDVVVVTIQYRLGALGYLVHPGLEAESASGKSGNYAVLDQIMALKWVKNNIELFGGDSSNITVFGESAGGVNTGNLMLTPLAKGLFHKAGIQSAVANMALYSDGKSKGIDFVNSYAGATGTDAQKIAFLRTLPADSIAVNNGPSPLLGGVLQQNFQPVLDGVIFTKLPTIAYESGDFNKMPLLIGSNEDEMSLSAPLVVTPAMVTALVNSRVPLSYRSKVLALYPPGSNNTQARESYVAILTDAQFTASVRRAARCISLNQQEPVWRYFFTYSYTLPQLAPYGAYHGAELFYVFNTLENSSFAIGNLFKPSDDSLQKVCRNYWTNFAKTGNPNATGLVNWVQYNAADDCNLELKATPFASLCNIRQEKLDLWDEMIGFNSCKPTVGIDELENKKVIFAYPNPSNGIWHIAPLADGEASWQVADVSGRVVLKNSSSLVNLVNHPNGLYFLTISVDGKNYSQLIVKE